MERGETLRIPTGRGGMLDVPLAPPDARRDELIERYWAAHPRFQFVKSVAKDAVLLDFGAGPGGLVGWKEWGAPARPDIAMYAVDIAKGEHFERYAGYEVVDPASQRTKFAAASFDAAVLSHVIEHVASQYALMAELRRLLKPGARVYLEWPRPESTQFPRARELASLGLVTSTINFYDDGTHLTPLSPDETKARLIENDFAIVDAGLIWNDFLAPQLISYGALHGDEETTTYGVWLLLGFSTYVVAQLRS